MTLHSSGRAPSPKTNLKVIVVEWERLHLQQGKYELYQSHPGYGKCTHTHTHTHENIHTVIFHLWRQTSVFPVTSSLLQSLLFLLLEILFFISIITILTQRFFLNQSGDDCSLSKQTFSWCSLHTTTIVARNNFLGLGYRLQHLLHIGSVWRGHVRKTDMGKKRKYCGSFYYIWKHTCGSIQPQRRLKNILLCKTTAGSNNYFHYRFNTRLFFNYSFSL